MDRYKNKKTENTVRFDVITAMATKNTIFWNEDSIALTFLQNISESPLDYILSHCRWQHNLYRFKKKSAFYKNQMFILMFIKAGKLDPKSSYPVNRSLR
jgi:hypothetical protein